MARNPEGGMKAEPVAFHAVLRRSTAAAVSSRPLDEQAICDRWAAGWPAKMRRLEADGTLIRRLIEQSQLERAALERAAGPEYAHLAEHEKLELLGPPGGL